MIESRLQRNAKLGTEEGRSKLCDQLFHGVGVIAKALAEGAIAALLWRGPVGQLMQQGRVVGLLRGAGGGSDK